MTKSRLEAFSDGVFAIAITLLIIDVTVPTALHGHSLAYALGHQWPQYVAYAISFLVIGIIWVNHHRTFALITRVNGPLAFLNIGLLAAVAFLPFPTALIAEYVRSGGQNAHVAAAVYSANMLVMAIWFVSIWIYVDRRHLHQLGRDARIREKRAYVGTPIYAITVGLSFISAPVTLAVHGVLAAFYALDTAKDIDSPSLTDG